MCSLGPLRLSSEEGGDGAGRVPNLEEVLGGGVLGTPCPARNCYSSYTLPAEHQTLLQHLFTEHHLVIADVERIALLADYMIFWKNLFNDKDLAEYCTTMLVDTNSEGKASKDEKYYLLSDVLPVDYQLRKDLQQKRLERVLAHQKLEREDKTYERECLICRTVIKGSRSDFLTHILEKHNLYIAKLENLVFTADLIEFINEKLTNGVCMYCEKTFKDRIILKEHMRKKGHKKINPKNGAYDKYFISNYLEMGRNWQSYMKHVDNKKNCHVNTKSNVDEDSGSESDGNWSDWDEKDTSPVICLFCKHSEDSYADTLLHMSKIHNFNFEAVTKELNFYEKLKIINYIRRQVFLKRCIECDNEFSNIETLHCHMSENNHFVINDPKLWNRPEFYFSTYEDDSFLYYLYDEDEDEIEEDTAETNISEKTNDIHISQEVALSAINEGTEF